MQALLTSDPIERTVVAGEPFTLDHGLGRPIRGYLVVWATAPVAVTVPDPTADTRISLTLEANASCDLRLVLL